MNNYRSEENESYFYLYRISYMWYGPLGFLVALIAGWITSLVARCISNEMNSTEHDSSLFSPIVAKLMQKKQKEEFEFRNMITFSKNKY